MMLRYAKMLILTGAFVGLGLASGEARASFLVQVTATLNAPTPAGVTAVSSDGLSTASIGAFPNAPPADVDVATSTSPVHETFGETYVSSTNASGVSALSLDYSWTLTFAHVVNGQAVGTEATTTVTGTIAGLVSEYASTLQNSYTSGPVTTPMTLVVDGRPLQVMLDAWTPPGTPPSATPDFSIALQYASGGGGGVNPVPEPGAVALMGVGGLVLAAARLRRKPRGPA